YKRLVYDEQLATDVTAYVVKREICGEFRIIASAKPGADLARIERIIDEELKRFSAEGPTADELQRVKTEAVNNFVRQTERVGPYGKSGILAVNETLMGDAGFYRTVLGWFGECTSRQLQQASAAWLNDDVYIVEYHPRPKFETTASRVDRTQ